MSRKYDEDLLASGIAVIAMSGRFPGSPDVDGLWRNLCAGVESVRELTDDELREAGVTEELRSNPAYVKMASVLEGVDRFDATFFGYSPREAELMDPQQRLLLEHAWEALETAGYDPTRCEEAIGVYVGSTLSSYLFHLASLQSRLDVASEAQGPAFLGNSPDFLATRLAYKLDLKGPAYAVHTACSTSLVGVHLACQGLLDFEADVAVAGGASVRVPHHAGYLYQESGITSPDGHTRPFDARGRGTVFGSGVGLVVLKRLEDALEDGDEVLAVIRGSATNNDGAAKVGFTAPSLAAQRDVVIEALAAAGVDADTVSYVEAHGTGTELGDPIELAALTQAFRETTDRIGYCAVGSVKSNLGHLDAASGVVGLIKTVLALRHGRIPPSLHFEQPNPKIDFAGSPFFVQTELTDWPRQETPRRAGVSSFGFGGTNVHVVLEEAPELPASGPSRPWQLLPLSARTPEALEQAALRLADWLDADTTPPLADVAYTLQVGRQEMAHRRVVAADGIAAAASALRQAPKPELAGVSEREDRPVAFLLPGQGAQYPGMGRELYETEPVFRRELDLVLEALEPHWDVDLREVIHPADAESEDAATRLRGTALAQPALFAVEVALARLWASWGIEPVALLGHSLGELTAAHLAGVFDLEDACRVVVARGRLMEAQPSGDMLSVGLPEAELTSRLSGLEQGLALAAVNAPSACTVSGPAEAVEELARQLAAEGIETRPLHTSHAFHSSMMDPVLPELEEVLRGARLRPPEIPFVSNVTGTWIRPGEATDPGYWGRQVRSTVRFATGVETLLGVGGEPFLIEVGPGSSLGSLVRRRADGAPGGSPAPSMPHPRRREAEGRVLAEALGRAWIGGVAVDWEALHGDELRRRVALPTYPFERRRYWVDGRPDAGAAEADEPTRPTEQPLHERPDLATGYAEPQGEVEQKLADIWSRAVGVARVGRDDDFFQLGGDSLLATRVLSRVRDILGVRLPMDRLFEDPTLRGLAAAVEAEGAPATAAPLEPAPRDGELPLSFPQERLWFLDQLDPDSSLYNMPSSLAAEGHLASAALDQAMHEILRRHEAVRTTFATVEGRPVQRIAEPSRPPWPRVDLTGLDPEDASAVAHGLAAEESERPFDLALGPMLRTRLLRLAPRRHHVLFTIHHISGDDASLEVLTREVAGLYEAFAAGRSSPLEELPIQYADFAIWQRRRLDEDALEGHLEYWRRRLEGAPVVELPTDRPRHSIPGTRGGRRSITIPSARAEALGELGREAGATRFMTLLAVFTVLLARLSDQRDLPVGTPIANRDRSEVENLIGFFVNTLVLRADGSGNPTFQELLERIRSVCLEAYEHQDMPFERLVEALQPERTLGRTPLVQVMLVLQSLSLEHIRLPELELRLLEPASPSARFDLTLYAVERSDGLTLALDYRTDLFDDTTASRLLTQLDRLVTAIVADPELPLGELPLFTAAQRQQILIEWGGLAIPPAPFRPVHRGFQAQAAAAPEAVALAFEGGSWTYRELAERAERLARQLVSLGVRPEMPVGVLLERSPDSVAALLAVLEAGGAYLPLDPAHPAERQALILEDAGVEVVITDREGGEGSGLAGVRLVSPGSGPDAPEPGTSPQRLHAGDPTPEQLAYLIYTSGSTGRPKAVMVPHRGLAATLAWRLESFRPNPRDRMLQTIPLTFDPSLWQIFGVLLSGGRLVLPPHGRERDPGYLVREMTRHRITITDFSPPLLRPWLEEEGIAALTDLRWVFVGGEALPPEVARSFLRRLPGATLVNMYGPTEASIDTTFWRVQGEPERDGVPIGRPIRGREVALLDDDFEPVPPRAVGRLLIGGRGLARGYWGRPRLTAESFLPDPLSGVPGARLYDTGDLARYRPDGNLEFLGRADHQVKVRGYRIELGEVEAAAAAHPGVGRAVVVAREHPQHPGHRRLVAYVVPSEGEGAMTDPSELRSFLAQRLPGYMVPAAFVSLETFPLTSSGKVDRQALPEPQESGTRATAAPATPLEERLAEVWRQVLGVTEVGRHDNFFELGGDSILSIQVVARAARDGLRLSPQQVFRHQTVADLAAVADETSAVTAPQGPVLGPAPLTPVQRWFFAQEPEEPHHWNQALLLGVRRPLAQGALESAAAALLDHHDALRLRFRREGDAWRQEHGEPGVEPPVEHVDLSGLEPEAQRRALERTAAEAQAGLDLTDGPVVTFHLFHLGDNAPDRLLVIAHHLVIDGVSWRVLVEDLEALLGSRSLPPKTTSFQTWAEGLWDLARSGEGPAGELDAWLDLLPTTTSSLPVDDPGGDNVEGAARTLTLELDREETRALLTQVPAASRARPEEILLTALARTVTAWSGGDELLVEMEGHGREDDLFESVDLSRTVGWLTSAWPVPLRAHPADDPFESLRSVRAALARVPGRGLGYGLLRHLGDDETAARLAALPQPEVSFNYLGQLDRGTDPDSLFTLAEESLGPLRSPRWRRPRIFEINASVAEERLRVDWTYCKNLHRDATVEALMKGFEEALRALLDRWRSPDARPCSLPSDFPLAGLEARELEQVEERIGVPLEDVYPLTPLQEGILFQSLYQARPGLYMEQLSCRLVGELDDEAFRAAWRRVTERQPALSTAFVWEGLESPLQAVARGVEPTWRREDFDALPAHEQEERIEVLQTEERLRQLDLSRPPLMRLSLARLGKERHLFIWTFHHLLLDGWAGSVVLQEVFEAYRAGRAGTAPALEPVRPFRGYIDWLQHKDPQAAEAYWRRVLHGFRAPTPLPLESPKTGEASAAPERGAEHSRLDAAIRDALDALGRSHQLTLGTLLGGAWALLLSRYARESDVVFGTTVSGRPADLPGVETMVGMFINTLPVRTRTSPEAELLPWLAALQAQVAELQEHQHSPLSRVQTFSDVPQGQRLFDSLVVVENYPLDASLRRLDDTRDDGIGVRIEDVEFVETTDFPLALTAQPGSRLELTLKYDPDRLPVTGARRLMGHFENLLRAMAAEPSRRLGELPLLSPSEHHQVLHEWNDPRVSYPANRCLHEVVEEQARRAPDAVAVLYEDQHVSYGGLLRRAGQLARRLRALGVGPEEPVAIAVERSPEMLVGVLGILLAGGAYVPVDPGDPEARLAIILEDTGTRVLLTQERFAADLPVASREVVILDAGGSDEMPGDIPREIGPASDPESLAYVIHTSGSTGRPKGVMIPHRGVVNRLLSALPARQLFPGDRFLVKAALSFDVSVLEIFLPWIAGGTAVLLRPGGQQDPAHLVQRMVDAQVTQAIFPPALLQLVLEQDALDACHGLHSVVSSADAFIRDVRDRFFDRLEADLYNRYGPTEASIAATSWKLSRHRRERRVPIGYPIAKARIYVAGSDFRLQPMGIPGELLLGGPGVGRGYLKRPGLTAAAFLPDPWSSEPGARLYATGDLVRQRPDGALDFLGRIDHQVKVRGFRVELREIEVALEEHPRVARSVVVDRQRDDGLTELVGYLVPRDEALDVDGVRRHLEERLPRHMVPTFWVVMDELPMLPSGKVDRRALPAPQAKRNEGERVEPRTDAERCLAAIWAEVLGLDHVGVEDNFFELGGDSIRSIRLLSQAKEAGFDLSAEQLFQHPTVAELAALGASGDETADAAISGPTPLSPPQRRFFARRPPEPHRYAEVWCLEPERPLAPELLESAVLDLLTRHDALRLRFALDEDGWQASYARLDDPLPVARVDLSGLPEGRRRATLEALAAGLRDHLDLADGPLLRVAQVDLGPEQPQRLLLAAHRLIADPTSWEILQTDLAALVASPDKAPHLAPETTSYRAWVEAMQPTLGEPVPADSDVDAAKGHEAAQWIGSLSREETRGLLTETTEALRLQPEEALLAGLLRALARGGGAEPPVVDVERSLRDEAPEGMDLARTVGSFTTWVSMELDIGPRETTVDVATAVKDHLRRRSLDHVGEERRGEVRFRHVGERDVRVGSDVVGWARDVPAPAPLEPGYRFEIETSVVRERLQVRWIYLPETTPKETVATLAESFFEELRTLMRESAEAEAPSYTPGDFAAVDLDQKQLEGILEKVGKGGPK